MKSANTHLTWLCACLALSLVGALSVNWSTLPALVNIVSTALGLTSLILSVIAIIMTIISNESLSNSLGNISSAANKISESTLELKSQNNVLSHSIDKLLEIPNSIHEMGSKIDEVSSKVNATHTTKTDKDTKSEPIPKNATNGAIVAMHIARRAEGKDIYFSCSDIVSPLLGQYCNGVIAGLRAAEVCDIALENSKFKVLSLKQLDKSSIDYFSKMLSEDPDNDTELRESIKSVDEFFSKIEP